MAQFLLVPEQILKLYIEELNKKSKMKNLTKIIMIAGISLICLQLNAQGIGIRGGFNLSNMLSEDNDGTYSDDFKMNPGFHVGATVDIPINGFLSVEPGLLFTTKGAKSEFTAFNTTVTAKTNLYYLDIPVLLKAAYKFDNNKVFVAVGPYAGIGLSGDVKYTSLGEDSSDEIKWGNNNESNLRRLEGGITFGAGVEISSFLIGASYDLGLSNIAAVQENGQTIKNRVLRFSVGYRFGK